MLIFDLAYKSSFVGILFVALCPYVSIGIVACLGQLLAINNVCTDWVMIIIIVKTIRQSLSIGDQWECGFNLDCIFIVLEWGSSSKIEILFDLYWLYDKIQFCTANSYKLLSLWWQFLTIIFMVFGTILTLHSSTESYNINRPLHLMFVMSFL